MRGGLQGRAAAKWLQRVQRFGLGRGGRTNLPDGHNATGILPVYGDGPHRDDSVTPSAYQTGRCPPDDPLTAPLSRRIPIAGTDPILAI